MANVSDTQFNLLLGISQRMEQTLIRIEQKIAPSGAQSGAPGSAPRSGNQSTSNLAAVALSVKLIVDALSAKNFKSKNADTVANFIQRVVDTTRDIDSTSLEQLASFTTGITNFIETMSSLSLMGIAKIALAGKLLFSGENSVIKKIIRGAVEAVQEFSGDNLIKLKQAGIGISLLANGLKTLASALAIMGLVAIAARLIAVGVIVALTTVKVFMSLGTQLKEMEAGFKAISILGKGLIVLAAGLATMALVATIVDVSLWVEIAAVILGVSSMFWLIGKMGPKITEGAEAIDKIAKSLVALSAGIALVALVLFVIKQIDPDLIWQSVLLVAAYGIVFALIGKAAAQIAKGSLAIVLGIGLGLFFFAGAIMLLGMALSSIGGIAAAILGPFIIGLYAAVFTAIGVEAGLILEGSLAVGIIGISLLLFSAGLMVFGLAIKGLMNMFGSDIAEAGLIAGAVIIGFGLAFAAVGNPLTVAFTLLGAAAMIVVSVALLTIAVGMTVFGVAVKAALAMGTIEKGKDGKYKFIGIDAIVSIMEGFGSIGWKTSIKAGLGAIAAVGVSVALVTLSVGLLAASYALSKIPARKDFTENLFNSNKDGIIDILFQQFANIGDSYGDFNVKNGTDPASRGAIAVRNIGNALSSLAGGIVAFADVNNVPVQIAKNGKLVYSTVSLVDTVENIKSVFLGDDDKKGNKKGLLYSLANVLSAIGDDKKITGVQVPGDGVGSIFKRFLSKISGDNPIGRGIKAVASIGDVLSALAGGITAFAVVDNIPIQVAGKDGKLTYIGVKLDTVLSNIRKVLLGPNNSDSTKAIVLDPAQPGLLTVLSTIFADIGKTYGDEGFFSDGDVKKGANAVKSMGDAISGIAQGILAFADTNKAVPTGFDPKTGKPTGFATLNIENIKNSVINLIESLPKTFAKLDMKQLNLAVKNAEEFKSFNSIIKDIGDSIKDVSDSIIPKGRKDEKGVLTMLSEEINNFVKFLAGDPIKDSMISSLDKLFTVFNKFSSIATSFRQFVAGFQGFNSVFGSFGVNMKNFSKNFTAFSPQLKNYEKFGHLLNGHAYYAPKFAIFEKSFGKMSTDLATFAKNFKIMDEPSIKAFKIWTEALSTFVQVDQKTFGDVADKLQKIVEASNVKAKAASNTVTENVGVKAPETQTSQFKPPEQASRIQLGPVQPAKNNNSAEISALAGMVSDLTIQVQNLVNALSDPKGLAVHMTNV